MPDSNRKTPRPCVFFDRDGVVNRSPGPGYVLRWEDFEFNPGIFDAIRTAKGKGYAVVLITSQKGVGKGLMSLNELTRIHQNMQEQLQNETGHGFDSIYAFTGLPDCRHSPKPDPEMILTAAAELNLDLSQSWMIGDADRDILMGHASNLEGTIRILGDKPVGEGAEASETLTSTEFISDMLNKKLRAGN